MTQKDEAEVFAHEVVEAVVEGDYEVAIAILEEMIEMIVIKKGER